MEIVILCDDNFDNNVLLTLWWQFGEKTVLSLVPFLELRQVIPPSRLHNPLILLFLIEANINFNLNLDKITHQSDRQAYTRSQLLENPYREY